MLVEAVDSSLSYTTAGNANWFRQTSTYYSGTDAAQSGAIADSQSTRMETTVQGAGTLTFYWKVSSESGYDYLEFWLDGVRQHRISGDVDWQQKSYNITGSGTHTLKWQYIKDSSVDDGSDCGWVDYVQWSGSMPPVYTPIPDNWDTVTYTYDAEGRRIAKAFDGQTCLKYVYDGHDCIAEYDGNNNLLRRYIYGPDIDQPISMIDVKDGNATWYYHFDALGSVVALSDANGDTAEVYEYSVYGQVAASDPNHMNLFMFTGREFDKETGLYYYRARYYNPEIGRFIQTDPVGYQAGMNLYLYCKNNPSNRVDPWGMQDSDANARIDCTSEEQWLELVEAYRDAWRLELLRAEEAFNDAGEAHRSAMRAERDALDAFDAAQRDYDAAVVGVGGAALAATVVCSMPVVLTRRGAAMCAAAVAAYTRAVNHWERMYGAWIAADIAWKEAFAAEARASQARMHAANAVASAKKHLRIADDLVFVAAAELFSCTLKKMEQEKK